jgi:uncharacterized protein (DUF2236 family)
MVWEVLLHPATITFHHAGQQQMQKMYKPIEAGVRDHEPISRKARRGTLTVFDTFERVSRGAGMHVPMWLGDTDTATRMAKHLHNIHKRVAGDVIDVSQPELGGYAASSPRESMWAALTEMHPMLRVYESFAFRDGKLPHRLSPQQRDQFISEVAAYCRLHGAPTDEVPTTMSDLAGLYAKYDTLFQHSSTIDVIPETGEDVHELMAQSIKKNFRLSHLRAAIPVFVIFVLLGPPVTGALSGKARRSMGLSPRKDKGAVVAKKLALPLAWLFQRRPVERHLMRLLWGPDAVALFESARKLHKQALEDSARIH